MSVAYTCLESGRRMLTSGLAVMGMVWMASILFFSSLGFAASEDYVDITLSEHPSVFYDLLYPEVGPVVQTSPIMLGDAEAPVSVVAFLSPVCPQCASFFHRVLPQLHRNEILEGKVRYYQYNIANVAAEEGVVNAASCMAKPLLRTDQRQEFWAHMYRELEAIKSVSILGLDNYALNLAERLGVPRAQTAQCINDTHLGLWSAYVRSLAVNDFALEEVPALFVNGKRISYEDLQDYDKLAKVLDHTRPASTMLTEALGDGSITKGQYDQIVARREEF